MLSHALYLYQSSTIFLVKLVKSLISGSIDLDELIDIICTFYDMEGVPRKESKRHAKRIFEALDEDGEVLFSPSS